MQVLKGFSARKKIEKKKVYRERGVRKNLKRKWDEAENRQRQRSKSDSQYSKIQGGEPANLGNHSSAAC